MPRSSGSAAGADEPKGGPVRKRDLVLVAVDPDDLGAHLRWEPSRGGDLVPHLYGELPVALARHVTPLDVDRDGQGRS